MTPSTPQAAARPIDISSPILVHVDGPIGRITLNAPERLNAVDVPLLAAFDRALRDLGGRQEVRVIAVAGAGRGFCAGANLAGGLVSAASGPGAAGSPTDEPPPDGTLAAIGMTIRLIRDSPKPVVALVQGVAAGVGVSLALATDYVIACDSASFVLAFAKIGLMPDGGATTLVAANIGRARALRLALTGERLDAATAAEWGLIAECVPADEFAVRCAELLDQLAASAPRAALATRRAINAATVDVDAALAREEHDQSDLLASADFAEGVAAFLEKRRPTFVGR